MLPPVSRKYIDFMTHRFIKGLIMFLIGCMILLLPILVNLGDIIGVPIIIGSMIAIIGFLIMCLVFKWRVSSVVEQLAVNQLVAGSNPALAAMFNFKCI